jgi:hypothetical protein
MTRADPPSGGEGNITGVRHLSKEALPRRKSVVGAIWVLTVSVGAVHLLWGSAVIRAARAWESGISSSHMTICSPKLIHSGALMEVANESCARRV